MFSHYSPVLKVSPERDVPSSAYAGPFNAQVLTSADRENRKAFSTEEDSFYHPGLQKRNEAVISAHFMHGQNLNSQWQIYTADEFNRKALVVSADHIMTGVVPVLQQRLQDVIIKRTNQSISTARKKSKDYGIEDANKITAAEMITEALLDPWFRKGPLANVNKIYLRDMVKSQIDAGNAVQLIVPLLPNKVDNPLKTKGTEPCFAEVNLLCRLAEIAGVIDAIYKKHASGKAPETAAQFTILADGHRFQSALNVSEQRVSDYQSATKWWITKLGFENIIKFRDYENELRGHLSPELLQLRETLFKKAHDNYSQVMWSVFDPYNMDQTLEAAVGLDPVPDVENPEARFVPLFKSILYTYESDLFTQICKEQGYDYEKVYREITQNIFKPFAVLTREESQDKLTLLQSGQKIALDDQGKESLRVDLLRKVWGATIDYLSAVKSDRDLMEDPVSQIYPNHVRYTIHSKKGQIGICTTGSKGGDLVQAWHGVAQLRPSKNGTLKFDNVSRLSAEGELGTPVILDQADSLDTDLNAFPISRMKQTEQPLFYVARGVETGNAEQLVDKVAQNLTRLIFC